MTRFGKVLLLAAFLFVALGGCGSNDPKVVSTGVPTLKQMQPAGGGKPTPE